MSSAFETTQFRSTPVQTTKTPSEASVINARDTISLVRPLNMSY